MPSLTPGRYALPLALLGITLVLAACGSHPTMPVQPEAAPRPARDGAPAHRADIMSIPDALPRPEPIRAAGNKSPYTVLGSTYRVKAVPPGYRERGYGSWYGTKFHGQNTSNGEPYDVYAMTAAHKTLPIPSYVRVTNLENGRKVIVRVNDRGPFHEGRIIDLSYAAAYRLGYAGKGTAPVEVELLDPNAPEWVARRGGKPTPVQLAAPSPQSQQAPAVQSRAWLQAGAFRSIESARSLQQTLVALLGQEVSIQSSDDAGDGAWHRVRVGPMHSMESLFETQRRIAAANLGTPRIVTQ